MICTIILFCLVFVGYVFILRNRYRLERIYGKDPLCPTMIGMIKQELLILDNRFRELNGRINKLELLEKKFNKLQKTAKDFEERLIAWDKRRDEKVKNSLSSFNHLYTKLHDASDEVVRLKNWLEHELKVKFEVRDQYLMEIRNVLNIRKEEE